MDFIFAVTLNILVTKIRTIIATIENDDAIFDKKIAEYQKRRNGAAKIQILWCEDSNPEGWSFKIDLPHATFRILEEAEGREVQCIAIVFSIKDLNR